MFCLTPQAEKMIKEKFLSGELTFDKIANAKTTEERRAMFSFLGNDLSIKFNESLEQRLLKPNQQRAMSTFFQKALGLKETAQRDIISSIMKQERLLNPKDMESFMADAVAKKYGKEVSQDEAKQIFNLAKIAKDSKDILSKDPYNKQKMIDFGNKYLDLTDYADSLKQNANPFMSFSNWWNLPKSALTSILHFSAPDVQGWGMISTGRFWEASGNMFKYFADSKNYRDLNAYIIAHPDYKLAIDGKLGLTKLGDKLSNREEAFQSSLLEHLSDNKFTKPAGELVLASNRAFAGMLNDLRFNRFVDLLNAARLHGEDIRIGSQAVKDIANAVNDFTGRGQLGTNDRYANTQVALNNLFFAPRKIIATMNMFNPVRYLDPKISPTAKMAATRQLIGSLTASFAVLQMAQLGGAQVNFDPRSPLFGKIKFGNTTFDITGGNASYLRTLSQIITDHALTYGGKEYQLGKKFGSKTSIDVGIKYFQNKLAPMVKVIFDGLYAREHKGMTEYHQPFTLSNEMADNLIPIFVKSFIDLVRNDGDNTAAYLASPLAVFGSEMHTQEPKK